MAKSFQKKDFNFTAIYLCNCSRIFLSFVSLLCGFYYADVSKTKTYSFISNNAKNNRRSWYCTSTRCCDRRID